MTPHSVILLSFKVEAPPDSEGLAFWGIQPPSLSCPVLPTSTLQYGQPLALEDGIPRQESVDARVCPALELEAAKCWANGFHSLELVLPVSTKAARMINQPQDSVRPWDPMVPNFHGAPRLCNSSLRFPDSLTPKSNYIDSHPQLLKSVGAALKFYYGGDKPSSHMGHTKSTLRPHRPQATWFDEKEKGKEKHSPFKYNTTAF